jgi:hypothetical protein
MLECYTRTETVFREKQWCRSSSKDRSETTIIRTSDIPARTKIFKRPNLGDGEYEK